MPFERVLDCRQPPGRWEMFDLIGGHFKAPMNHKVEVIGISGDRKLNNGDSFGSGIGPSTHEQGDLDGRFGEDDRRDMPVTFPG